jgi:hypothetical protein
MNGVWIVALIPAFTDGKWWHEFIEGKSVRFLRGRVWPGIPIASAIVIFQPDQDART